MIFANACTVCGGEAKYFVDTPHYSDGWLCRDHFEKAFIKIQIESERKKQQIINVSDHE